MGCTESELRSIEDIKNAHDRLVSILKGAIPNPFPQEAQPYIFCAVDVLCWTLQHNDRFGLNLETIDWMMFERGYELAPDDESADLSAYR